MLSGTTCRNMKFHNCNYEFICKGDINSFRMCSRLANREAGAFVSEELSKFNHSCDPNCYPRYDGSRVTVLALREIFAGEEVN